MRNKGFTLIELLAVIVILAIIALIATPIILGIIKDSKKESDKRSIELYADALKNSIAKYQLNGQKLEVSTLKTTDGRTFSNSKLKVDYDGDVVCKTIEVYEDGKIYLNNCEVNGKEIEYKYGKSNIPEPVSFKEDSWKTISLNVQAGNIEVYKKNLEEGVNNTKTVDMGIYGTHTVRIANTSTPKECSTIGFSQTACGFVVEFEDIITLHKMNPSGEYKGVQYSYGWNVDGYPASSMYTFVNNDIYNSLPEDLKSVIIDTKVVSSHGNTTGETNFTTTDKLYLLSTGEVWEQGTSNKINYDTARENTRQLDYYKDVAKVTTTSYSGAVKKYKGNAYYWWLRSACSIDAHSFYVVYTDGGWRNSGANDANGVAVAFRIG